MDFVDTRGRSHYRNKRNEKDKRKTFVRTRDGSEPRTPKSRRGNQGHTTGKAGCCSFCRPEPHNRMANIADARWYAKYVDAPVNHDRNAYYEYESDPNYSDVESD